MANRISAEACQRRVVTHEFSRPLSARGRESGREDGRDGGRGRVGPRRPSPTRRPRPQLRLSRPTTPRTRPRVGSSRGRPPPVHAGRTQPFGIPRFHHLSSGSGGVVGAEHPARRRSHARALRASGEDRDGARRHRQRALSTSSITKVSVRCCSRTWSASRTRGRRRSTAGSVWRFRTEHSVAHLRRSSRMGRQGRPARRAGGSTA